MTVMIIRLNTLEVGVVPSSSRTNPNQQLLRKGTNEKIAKKTDTSNKAGVTNSLNKKDRAHHRQTTAANEITGTAEVQPERKADRITKDIRSNVNPAQNKQTSPPKKRSKC